MGTTVEIGELVGGYIESPPQSGYFLFPESEHYLVAPGLYSPGTLEETTPGLYSVPSRAFASLAYMRGITSNLRSFSVQEDATTIDPSNYSGGAGQVTVEALEAGNSLLALSKQMYLADDDSGIVRTTVRDVSTNDGMLTLTADSVLGLFNAQRTAAPQVGTLRQALSYYMGLVGITNGLRIEGDLATRVVAYPGWVGNMWDNIKQILSAEQIEMTVVLDDVVVRPLRTRVASLRNGTTISRSVNKQSAARQVEVFWFNNTPITNGEVYPVPSEEERPSPQQVEANEITTFTIQMDASLSSVNQPVCVDWVDDRSYANSQGVYSVVGTDGLPVTAAQWRAQGGNLSVAITDDPSIIEVTVKGPSDTRLSPYRIAMSSGNYYNSLHITGTGVAWKKESTILDTGVENTTNSEDIGATVENPFISTYAKALTAGQQTARAYSMTHTINGNVVRDGAQLFGNVAGSRIITPDSNYRINSVTVGPEGTSFEGSEDTTMADFNAVWVGKTMAEFNAFWQGKSQQEFATTPLRGPHGNDTEAPPTILQ